MAEHWEAVGRAVTARMRELRMSQLELAAESRVSPATIREIQHNKLARRRNPITLQALSTALKWPADYLGQVLSGETALPYDDEANDPVLRELNAVHDELRALRDRVAALEGRLDGGDARP